GRHTGLGDARDTTMNEPEIEGTRLRAVVSAWEKADRYLELARAHKEAGVPEDPARLQRATHPARRAPSPRIACSASPENGMCTMSAVVRDHRGDGSAGQVEQARGHRPAGRRDRKSTRLNSSHVSISYAVSCLKQHN